MTRMRSIMADPPMNQECYSSNLFNLKRSAGYHLNDKEMKEMTEEMTEEMI